MDKGVALSGGAQGGSTGGHCWRHALAFPAFPRAPVGAVQESVRRVVRFVPDALRLLAAFVAWVLAVPGWASRLDPGHLGCLIFAERIRLTSWMSNRLDPSGLISAKSWQVLHTGQRGFVQKPRRTSSA